MTVEEKVQAVLVAATSLTSSVPATRIRVPGDWQNLPRPYIVHRPVTLRPTETHGGLRALRIWDFYQVGVVADTYSAGRAIVELVINALKGSHTQIQCQVRGGLVYVGRDEEKQVEEFAVNFMVAESAS